jgi:hypothetical protein
MPHQWPLPLILQPQSSVRSAGGARFNILRPAGVRCAPRADAGRAPCRMCDGCARRSIQTVLPTRVRAGAEPLDQMRG